MKRRIEAHRQARPQSWRTLEATTDVGRRIKEKAGPAEVVIVDCITLLVNNIFNRYGNVPDERLDAVLLEEEVTTEIDKLVECINQVKADFIIVTNEVGLGLVPANRLSRLYRDLLGKTNQMLAQRAGQVYLIVSGLPVPLKPADGSTE